MSLLDDDLMDNLDLYVIKNELINFLKKYNWYDDIVESKMEKPSKSFFYSDKNYKLHLIYQSRYEIQIQNNRVKLVRLGANNSLHLIFEDESETIKSIPKYILDCLKMYEIKIHYGTKKFR